MSQFRYRKRTFLSPISTGFTSYIYAEAESSDDGEYKLGNYMLVLADCRRRIELEFFLGTARHRRQSIAKAELLVKTVTNFTDALKAEATLIEMFEKNERKNNGSISPSTSEASES